ncbi:MAG: hypothetical protein U0271_29325 [Polyangiaceae bacterium]
MSAPPTIETIVEMLTPSLGAARARELCEQAAKDEGITGPVTPAHTVAILKRLEKSRDTAGLAARLALARLDRQSHASVADLPAASEPLSTAAPASQAARPKQSVQQAEIVAILARSLGDAKAAESVAKCLAALGIQRSELTPEEAGRVFDNLMTEGGVVATVARFAKARFLLRG